MRTLKRWIFAFPTVVVLLFITGDIRSQPPLDRNLPGAQRNHPETIDPQPAEKDPTPAAESKSAVIILLDDSHSMLTVDEYDKEKSTILQSAFETYGWKELSRFAIAKHWLLQDQGKELQRLAKDHLVSLYLLSNPKEPFVLFQSPAEVKAVLPKLQKLEPQAKESPLGTALDQLLGHHLLERLDRVERLILLSDGLVTRGRPLEAAGDVARRVGIPIDVVPIGNTTPLPQIRLLDVLSPEIVFLNEPFPVHVHIQSAGAIKPTVTIQLFQANQKQPLQTKTLQLSENTFSNRVEFEISPAQKKMSSFRVELTGQSQAGKPLRSVQEFSVEIRSGARRVLLVEDGPRWEYRHLKRLLEKTPEIQLSTLLYSASRNFAELEPGTLPEFPQTLKELARYDLVILGDVGTDFLGKEAPELLQKYVSERSGTLLVIAGTRNHLTTYKETPLADLVPVEIPTENQLLVLKTDAKDPFPFRLTPLGWNQHSLRLAKSSKANKELWSQADSMYWRFPVHRVRPLASVLMETAEPAADGNAPLIVEQYFGSGRVRFHAFDETWRWRKAPGIDFYERFWIKTIRDLARGKSDKESRLVAFSERNRVQLGEEIRFRIRLHNGPLQETEPPLKVEVKHSREGAEMRLLTPIRDKEPGMYRVNYLPQKEGDYQFRFSLGDELQETKLVKVRDNLEPRDRPSDFNALWQLARMTKGQIKKAVSVPEPTPPPR